MRKGKKIYKNANLNRNTKWKIKQYSTRTHKDKDDMNLIKQYST